MGLFDKVFKSQRDISKEEIVEVPWHPLDEMGDLDGLEKESQEKTVVIFKHSTRCGISRMVLRNFENEFNEKESDTYKLYFLDLLARRDISDEIARRFKVQHESPQLIIIRDGKVVHHASHHSIKAETVKDYLKTKD